MATEEYYDYVTTEVDDEYDYVTTEVDDDYVATEEEEEEDDEYGYLSDNFSMGYDDDEEDLESLSNFELLKVPAEAYKDLSPEERVRWMTAHFIIQKNDFYCERQESKEEQVSEGEKQVSKVEEESKVAEEEEEESKVAEEKEEEEEEDGDIEEESKVPKTNDDDGGSGPRGTSWKTSSKPGGV